MERVTGIEPALSAWEAEVLPLNYTRACRPRTARLESYPAAPALRATGHRLPAGAAATATSLREDGRARLNDDQHCTSFVHSPVRRDVRERPQLWTVMWTNEPRKLVPRSACGASSGRTRTSPTARPEGSQERGNPDQADRRTSWTDRRTTDHLDGATRRAADGAAGVRTDRKVDRHRTTRERATARRWGAASLERGWGPGNRDPCRTVVQGPSDAYSEGPSCGPGWCDPTTTGS
jgi:hypothetical protein